MILNICMKFQEVIFNGFHVKHRHYFVRELLRKAERRITKTIHIQELWLLCSAHRLMMLKTCMKFHDHILNGFKVIK